MSLHESAAVYLTDTQCDKLNIPQVTKKKIKQSPNHHQNRVKISTTGGSGGGKRKKNGSPLPPIRRSPPSLDSVGRCIAPRPTSKKLVNNLINQCALRTLIYAKMPHNQMWQTPQLLQPSLIVDGQNQSAQEIIQADTLSLIQKRTVAGESYIDLSESGLSDTSMIVLGSVLQSHPTISIINLEGNPNITDASADILLQVIALNTNLVQVHLSNTGISKSTVDLIHSTCDQHCLAKIDIEEKRQRKRLRKAHQKWNRSRERQVSEIFDDEKESRARIRTERVEALASLKNDFQKSYLTIERKELRLVLRKKRQQDRQQLDSVCTLGRHQVIVLEQESRLVVEEALEFSTRGLIYSEQYNYRTELKKSENSDWILQRRAEKNRQKHEATQRMTIESQEAEFRTNIQTSQDTAAIRLQQEDNDSQIYYRGKLQERIEMEQAEEWKRKQEEIRVETEKQWKKDREIREAARRETERQREREKEMRVEHVKRVSIEKEEEKKRDLYNELLTLDRRVAKARESVGKSERARTALYACAPSLKLHAVTNNTVHYLGEFNGFLRIAKEDSASVTLEGILADHTRWKDAEKVSKETRSKLCSEVAEVEKTLRTRSIELAPIQHPELNVPVSMKVSTLSPSPHQKGGNNSSMRRRLSYEREKDLELQKKVDEALQEGNALVWHESSKLQFNDPPSYDEARTTKGEILGGDIQVELLGHEELQPFDRLSISNVEISGNKVSTPVEEFATLDDINQLLGSMRYKCTALNQICATRIARISVKLRMRHIDSSPGGGVISSQGAITSNNPFTDVVEVEATAECRLLVNPPLIHIPKEFRIITYVEDTSLDKGALVTDVSVSEVPWRVAHPEQVDNSSDGLTVAEENALYGVCSYNGGCLIINYLANYSPDDEIILRRYFEDDISISAGKYLHYGDRGEGPIVAEVESGQLVTHKEREEKGVVVSSQELKIRFTSDLCKANFVVKLLKRLRYVNVSQNPSVLQRELGITLCPPGSHLGSQVRIDIEVVSEDDPTLLELTTRKLFYRPMGSQSVPEHLRCHLKKSELPLFYNCRLLDPDTVHVKGGSIKVSCVQGSGKGDSFVLREDSLLATQQINGISVIIYDKQPVAKVLEHTSEVLQVQLSSLGHGSIPFIQHLLRNIVYVNTQYSPAESWRTYDLSIYLGPSIDVPSEPDEGKDLSIYIVEDTGKDEEEEGDQLLEDKVEVRLAMELFEVGSHWSLEYKEGTGAVRLAPFEVCPDQQGFVESYTDGYLLVEVTQGATTDDILNLRAPVAGKDGEMKITLRPGVDTIEDELLGPSTLDPKTPRGVSPSESSFSEPQPEELARDSSGSEILNGSTQSNLEDERNLRDRVRTKIQQAISVKREQRDNMLQQAKQDLKKMVRHGVDERAGKGEVTVSDITTSGKKVGTLIIQPSKLLVRFASKGVSRKDVLATLRLLTYANRSNVPDVLQKIIRISVKDSALVPTQAIVVVDIQDIDDVTEIRLASCRPKFRPGMKKILDMGCYALAGLRRAALTDPDTEFFDGGSLVVELVGGGTKGDTLSFMTPEQQHAIRLEANDYYNEMKTQHQQNETAPIWDIPIYEGTFTVNGKQIFDNDFLIGILDYPRCSAPGCNNIRVQFTNKHPQPSITIAMVSYALNCIAYNTASDRLQSGQRTYLIKVKDAENPMEGKIKCFVDVSKPLLSVAPAKGPKKGPCNEPISILDKFQTCVAEGKPQSMLQHGATCVSIVEGFVEGDTLIAGASGNNIVVKEGNIMWGLDFLGKITISQNKIRVEHSWASKLTAKALQALCSSVVLKATTPGQRVVEFLVSDGVADPNCVKITIAVG